MAANSASHDGEEEETAGEDVEERVDECEDDGGGGEENPAALFKASPKLRNGFRKENVELDIPRNTA